MSSKLDAIAIESLYFEINEIESSIDSVHTFSDEFERKIKRAIWIGKKKEDEFNKKKQRESRKYVHISGHRIRRSLLVSIIAISIFISSFAVIGAVKPGFYLMIKEDVHDWIIRFGSDTPAKTRSIKDNLTIPTLPEGYSIAEQSAEEVFGFTRFTDATHEIILQQLRPEDSTIKLCAGENAKHIMVEGCDVVVNEQTPDIAFVFTTDEFAYLLDGNCDYEILYQMVEEIITK